MPATWIRSTALLLIAVAVYFQTWGDIWPLWAQKYATYTHGALIAAISAGLVWRARSTLEGVASAGNPRVLPLVLLLSIAWVLAARANLLVLHACIWPVLSFSILWAGVGRVAASRLAFPLAFLYFAFPFWHFLEPALHFIAAHITSFLISVTGTRATVDGSFILLPNTTIEIILACGGAHFFAVSLAMGALAGEARGDPPASRLLIMVLAGLMGIAFNAIRILLIVLSNLHPRLHAGMESIGHITFGWWVFALDIIVFFLALRLVPLPKEKESPPHGLHAITAAADPGWRNFMLALAAAVAMPLGAYLAPLLGHADKIAEAPRQIPGVGTAIQPDSRWEPHFVGAAWSTRSAILLPNGRILDFYQNEYARQSEGRELFARESVIFPAESFTVQESAATALNRKSGSVLPGWKVQLLDQSGRRWAAFYTYTVGGRPVRSRTRARLETTLRSLYGRPAAGVFAAATPCTPDCDTVDADLERYASGAYDAYEAARNGS